MTFGLKHAAQYCEHVEPSSSFHYFEKSYGYRTDDSTLPRGNLARPTSSSWPEEPWPGQLGGSTVLTRGTLVRTPYNGMQPEDSGVVSLLEVIKNDFTRLNLT